MLIAHYGILEEAARAAAIRIAVNQQHSLGLADAADDGRHFGKARFATLGSAFGKRPLQIGVAHGGRAAGREPVVHAGDDVSPAILRIEAAAAIGKAALGRGKLDEAVRLKVEGPHPLDYRSHLLPISADILHRSSAHRAGNSGKALYPCAISLERVRSTKWSQSSPAAA